MGITDSVSNVTVCACVCVCTCIPVCMCVCVFMQMRVCVHVFCVSVSQVHINFKRVWSVTQVEKVNIFMIYEMVGTQSANDEKRK